MTTRFRGEHLLENAAGFLAGARHLSGDDRHSREILFHHIACAIEQPNATAERPPCIKPPDDRPRDTGSQPL